MGVGSQRHPGAGGGFFYPGSPPAASLHAHRHGGHSREPVCAPMGPSDTPTRPQPPGAGPLAKTYGPPGDRAVDILSLTLPPLGGV
jgi:hypothetical protein